jgi:thioredoxin reductase (NADPH)
MPTPTRHPRHDQMFPVLGLRDVERLKRFGTPVTYRAGTAVATRGSVATGFVVLLSGRIEVSQEQALAWRRQWEKGRRLLRPFTNFWRGESTL